MKKLLLTLTIIISITITVNAQFNTMFEQGVEQQKKGEYYPAIKSFSAAILFTDDKEKITEAKNRINFCADKLNKLKIDAVNANKKTKQILKALLPKGVTNIYSYFDSIGNYYFYDLGEYQEAVKNYDLARNAPDKPNKTNIETKFTNAHNCLLWQNNALKNIKEEKYDLAEKEIIKVLEINPNARKTIIIASAIKPLYGMQLVQAGEFMMGSDEEDDEKPVHKVKLSTFEISKYEVTNLQYAVFLNRYGSEKIKTGDYEGQEMIYEHNWGVWKNTITGKWEAQKGYEYHPVVYVTWYGAYEYCKFYDMQLPSEAQLEYAARGGIVETRRGVSLQYAGSNNIDSVANYSGTGINKTQPVGLLKPNQLGIYDMSGNVWEWCMDWYDKEFYQNCFDLGIVTNPLNEDSSSFSVIRGGSWYYYATVCRIASRFSYLPTDNFSYFGLRVCRVF